MIVFQTLYTLQEYNITETIPLLIFLHNHYVSKHQVMNVAGLEPKRYVNSFTLSKIPLRVSAE